MKGTSHGLIGLDTAATQHINISAIAAGPEKALLPLLGPYLKKCLRG